MSSAKKAAAPSAPPVLDVRQRFKIPEACRILKCSRSHFYKAIVGRIKLIREGACVYVPGCELARLADPDAPQVAVPVAATAEQRGHGRGRPRKVLASSVGTQPPSGEREQPWPRL